MKTSIRKKIETLLLVMYGDSIPESRSQENKSANEKKEMERRRCATLPLEFIRLIL